MDCGKLGVALATAALACTSINSSFAEDPVLLDESLIAETVLNVSGVPQDTSEIGSPSNLPSDPGQPVTFDGSDFGLSILEDGTTSTSDVNGLRIYSGTDTATSTVIQPTDQGANVMVVLQSPAAPSDFSFDLHLADTDTAALEDDGSVSVTSSDGKRAATVQTPWAVDANGSPLTTFFSLDGGVLTQTVVPDSQVVYPVVADPAVTVHDPDAATDRSESGFNFSSAAGMPGSCRLKVNWPHPSSTTRNQIHTRVESSCTVLVPVAHSVGGETYRARWFGWQFLGEETPGTPKAKSYVRATVALDCNYGTWFRYKTVGRGTIVSASGKTYRASAYEENNNEIMCGANNS